MAYQSRHHADNVRDRRSSDPWRYGASLLTASGQRTSCKLWYLCRQSVERWKALILVTNVWPASVSSSAQLISRRSHPDVWFRMKVDANTLDFLIQVVQAHNDPSKAYTNVTLKLTHLHLCTGSTHLSRPTYGRCYDIHQGGDRDGTLSVLHNRGGTSCVGAAGGRTIGAESSQFGNSRAGGH